MKIGFTGTRNGMTAEQRTAVRALLLETPGTGVHGDCIGADADFDAICKELGYETYCLPCDLDDMRAHCTEARAEPTAPMQRNRAIVAQADRMIACPPNFERIKRGSGTWATIRFAEQSKKPLAIVFPDGRVESR
jgi:hypothetical protein